MAKPRACLRLSRTAALAAAVGLFSLEPSLGYEATFAVHLDRPAALVAITLVVDKGGLGQMRVLPKFQPVEASDRTTELVFEDFLTSGEERRALRHVAYFGWIEDAEGTRSGFVPLRVRTIDRRESIARLPYDVAIDHDTSALRESFPFSKENWAALGDDSVYLIKFALQTLIKHGYISAAETRTILETFLREITSTDFPGQLTWQGRNDLVTALSDIRFDIFENSKGYSSAEYVRFLVGLMLDLVVDSEPEITNTALSQIEALVTWEFEVVIAEAPTLLERLHGEGFHGHCLRLGQYLMRELSKETERTGEKPAILRQFQDVLYRTEQCSQMMVRPIAATARPVGQPLTPAERIAYIRLFVQAYAMIHREVDYESAAGLSVMNAYTGYKMQLAALN